MKAVIKSTENTSLIKKKIKALDDKGKFNAYKYCGKIKLLKDPLEIQKSMRAEWQ
jgi:hypothetical protein